MEVYIYHSADFQCPDTGIPVWLAWNEDTGVITAEICELVIDLLEYEMDDETRKDTEDWCKHFREYAEDLDEANDIAEKYDTWF